MLTLQAGRTYFDQQDLVKLADIHQTPLYVYSKNVLEHAFHNLEQAFGDYPHLVCYAVKANSNLAVLNVLAKQGAGFDIVSIGELKRVIKAGGDPKKVIFSGVGKTPDEMYQALEMGIHCFNVESVEELDILNSVATKLNRKAPISLRINPNVDAKTHPYISTGLRENKFGISMGQAFAAYKHAHALPFLEVIGIDCHIGSQLTDISPYSDALDRLLELVDALDAENIKLKHLDMGGGIGIAYQQETCIKPKDWADLIIQKIANRNLSIIIEPGRSIVANAGVLLTKVLLTKDNEGKHFAVVDAGMNDLIRPTLYEAWMNIVNVSPKTDEYHANHHVENLKNYDIVGPICETGDFLGKSRELCVNAGDVLAVTHAGAYGFVMSSNYNTRARAAEVMITDGKVQVVRKREKIEDLYELESILD